MDRSMELKFQSFAPMISNTPLLEINTNTGEMRGFSQRRNIIIFPAALRIGSPFIF